VGTFLCVQVVLQLIALLAQRRKDGQEASETEQQKVLFLNINVAIGISMTIAVLNLFKTLIILKFESVDLDLSLIKYVRCDHTPACNSWRLHCSRCCYTSVALCNRRQSSSGDHNIVAR
jgi:hypothetical protein